MRHNTLDWLNRGCGKNGASANRITIASGNLLDNRQRAAIQQHLVVFDNRGVRR